MENKLPLVSPCIVANDHARAKHSILISVIARGPVHHEFKYEFQRSSTPQRYFIILAYDLARVSRPF